MHTCETSSFAFVSGRREIAIRCVFTGSDASKDGMKALSHLFVMHSLAKIAATGVLDELIDRNKER